MSATRAPATPRAPSFRASASASRGRSCARASSSGSTRPSLGNGGEPSSSGESSTSGSTSAGSASPPSRGSLPAPRALGGRRRWDAAASSDVEFSLSAALPPLIPWAEARVEAWAGAWEKAAALSPNLPIAVVDLMPEATDHPEHHEEQRQRTLGPFETEFGAFIYDKGYRQLFRALGYPGADAEAKMALERLNPAARGGACLDVSCGPGIITGRIAAGLRGYGTLIASDVSEAMTKRAASVLDTLSVTASVRPDASAAPLPCFAAVRADVGEMPFASDSIDAVHSSAGAHCWPEPKRGFAEVARVLKPGGVFVMSTVVLAGAMRDKYAKENIAADAEEYDAEVWDMNTPFWDAGAVVGMLEKSGMVDVEIVREDKCFVMLAGRKPTE